MLPLLIAVATLNPIGHVSDFAHLLRPETVTTLEQTLTNLEKETGAEVAVVTIDTHGNDETIETYAEKLFQEWGIGKAKEDNGVLLLIARDDREMRIEVGYGLEPIITDIESAHIISDVLTPAFKAGDYDEGVTQAVERIISDINNGAAPVLETKPKLSDKEIFYLILFLIIFSINIYRWRKGKAGLFLPIFIGGGDRGGKSGGFGGFGGGMSGGGGASGKW